MTSGVRIPSVPELPPLGEAVGMPEYEAVSWHVLLALSGTPKEIVDKLHGEIGRILAMPAIRQKIADIGLIPHDGGSVEDMRGYIKVEGEKWGTLVRGLGLEGTQ